MHSFRHSMRDRLRSVECPADIVDQLGGWQTGGVGHGYGNGYPLSVLAKWMTRIAPIMEPYRFVCVVYPKEDGTILVNNHMERKGRLELVETYSFLHNKNGSKAGRISVASPDMDEHSSPTRPFYQITIAMLNTRGCQIDLRRPPAVMNQQLKRQGKPIRPSHWVVNSKEYLTALNSGSGDGRCRSGDGSRASPIPHLRRAHERVIADGRRLWIPSMLVNVRSEGDIAFVEKRKAYRVSEH